MVKHSGLLAAAIALCLLHATPAAAGDGLYIGMSAISFSQSATTAAGLGSGKSTGFMAQIGSNFNEFLGSEYRFGGTGRATLSHPNATLDATINSLLLRGRIPLSDSIRLYGLFGTTSGTMVASGALTGKANRQSISYGGGLEMMAGSLSASVEWMRYWNNVNTGPGIDITLDGIGVTLGLNF